ncbi:SecDF P1 head subdomain-containing protein [Halalkalibacter krulwichiae]|uniref:SecDF P1 head subdomain-containing protein n=1 Tax=Halalkalibacter krulwichiae TaxID=199441 RepID=UPI00268A64D6
MVKKGRIIAFFLIVAILAGLISTTVFGVAKEIKLGLDLQGGFEILYQVEPANEGDTINNDVLRATVSALYQRVNVLGVSEPNIRIEGDDRIRVQLAGVADQQTARELLATEASLTIRDVYDEVLVDGSDLRQNGAGASFHPDTNDPIVTLTLNDARQMEQISRDMLARDPAENLLVMWLDFEEGVDSYAEEAMKQDPKYLSAATVVDVIPGNTATITGSFTVEETQFLAEVLNAGSLPVKLEEMYSNSVGASLGNKRCKKQFMLALSGLL